MGYTREERRAERPITVKQNTVEQLEPGNHLAILGTMGITERSGQSTIMVV